MFVCVQGVLVMNGSFCIICVINKAMSTGCWADSVSGRTTMFSLTELWQWHAVFCSLNQKPGRLRFCTVTNNGNMTLFCSSPLTVYRLLCVGIVPFTMFPSKLHAFSLAVLSSLTSFENWDYVIKYVVTALYFMMSMLHICTRQRDFIWRPWLVYGVPCSGL